MLILVGPSASGKTEAVKLLISEYHMEKLVTYTTRAMRVHEKEGIDYHFLSSDEFQKRIKDNFFLEYVCYNNNYYGTSFSDITDNKVVILEPQGLNTYLKKLRDQVKVIYLKCDPETLKDRMLYRGDSLENINNRLALDSKVFTSDLEQIADYTIDSSKVSLSKMAQEIYQFYKK